MNYSNYLNGLMFSYSMESIDALVDDLGSNSGTNTNVTFETGRIGNGYGYNGTNAVSTVPHSSLLASPTTEVTLMADVYPTANGQSSISNILGKANNTSGVFLYQIGLTTSNTIRFRVATGTAFSTFISTDTLTLNQWHRVICRFKSGELADIHINLNINTFTPVTRTMEDVALDMYIGAGHPNSATNRRFAGILDNVMGWNRALTLDEINKLLNESLTYLDFINRPRFFLMF